MASPKVIPEHHTTVKGAEVMLTNYSFLWQHLKPSQEFHSKLLENSFINEADREELNSYGQRFAQNAVIIHRILYSNHSPLSLLDGLATTGQRHIANKLMQGT